MKNRRSWVSVLLSPVSMKGLRYTSYTTAAFIVLFGILQGGLLAQIEHILKNTPGLTDALGTTFVLDVLFTMKFLIPLALAGVAIFVWLGELGHSRQLKSETVPILAQIKMLEAGEYTKKRNMRTHDSLQPIMDALHRLADQLETRKR